MKPMKVLSADEAKIVGAIGQTLFMRDSTLDLDGIDVGIVSYIDDYLYRVPASERAQFRALLHAFDKGMALTSLRPGARFCTASHTQRLGYIDSWERSGSYLRRKLYEALRAVFTIAYVDAPAVRQAIGMEGQQ